uniref:Putative secreted protein n=1 Tax=Ixodes scapularis TaxID=6945 RepID=A0A4D5RK53_IXOSC
MFQFQLTTFLFCFLSATIPVLPSLVRAYAIYRAGSRYMHGVERDQGLLRLPGIMRIINAFVRAEQQNQKGCCVNMTLPNAYGIDSCFHDVGRDLCDVSAAGLSSLVMCVIDKMAAFGFNGYLFTNFYPTIAELFKRTGQNLTTLDYLASYCLDGANAPQLFCEVDPSIEDSACGTPIVFQVPAPQPDENMCEPNEACQSVPPTNPTFSRLLSDEFVCLVNLQPMMTSMIVYNDVGCYLSKLLNQTDYTGYPVTDQVETVQSQLLAATVCTV